MEEIAVLADIWMEDLGHFDDNDFIEAVKRHRTTSRRFPTPAEMVKHCRAIADLRQRRQPKLPESTVTQEEQEEINRRGFARIRAIFGKAKNRGKSNMIGGRR
jgi:hypothetical protein